MKNLNILILLIFNCLLNAQTLKNEFGFDLKTLSVQKAYSNDSILPRIENDKFYYFDTKKGIKIFNIGFQEAYPFIGKSALVKRDGKYGIIDLKGNYLIEPNEENYILPPYNNESNLIIFSEELIFDLNTGETNKNGYIICEEPAFPDYEAFSNKLGKYGVKNFSNEIILKAKYDSIIDINFNYFIVKLNNKIGILNTKGENIIPFEYVDISFSRGDYYQSSETIGLKKDNDWFYFELFNNKRKILSSKYKCVRMHNLLLNNSVGIFENNNQLNILFENGKTLNDYYDWISENGLIAVKNKSVYFLNPDGSSSLYF